MAGRYPVCSDLLCHSDLYRASRPHPHDYESDDRLDNNVSDRNARHVLISNMPGAPRANLPAMFQSREAQNLAGRSRSALANSPR